MIGQERRDRLRVVTIACAMLSAAIIAAFAIATQREPPHIASSDPPVAGTSGLARPHPPLDRAPGEPLGSPAAR